MNAIKKTDSAAVIASKWCSGNLPGVTAEEALREVKRRLNRDTRRVGRPKLRVVT